MRPNPQFPVDLITFTWETLNGKLHFLWIVMGFEGSIFFKCSICLLRNFLKTICKQKFYLIFELAYSCKTRETNHRLTEIRLNQSKDTEQRGNLDRMAIWLTHSFPMQPFSTSWKHQKTVRNGLIWRNEMSPYLVINKWKANESPWLRESQNTHDQHQEKKLES